MLSSTLPKETESSALFTTWMYTEWILFDSETDRLRLCEAYDQRDAIRIAISQNILPRKTDDIRPRSSRKASDNTVMSPEEFQSFIDQLSE